MRKQNGLSYIKTILLMIIIAFLVCGAVYFIRTQYEKEQMETIRTNMLLIQGKAKIIAEEQEALDQELKGIKIEERQEEEQIKKLIEEKVITIEKDSKYYILDSNTINEIELHNIKIGEGETYIVNYADSDVIYIKHTNTEQKYYKLSDLINENTQPSENNEENKE